MIVVMIILAAVVVYQEFGTTNTAIYAKFVQEFEEVEKCVSEKRVINAKNDIANINKGFSKVKLTGDIPYHLLSITPDEKQAYLVDLSYIGCDALVTGRAYTNYQTVGDQIKTVTFGKDDVYVFDASGKLYYVQGIKSDGVVYYDNNKDKGAIDNVNISTSYATNSLSAKVTITVEAANAIDTVYVAGQEANKKSDGVYEIDITENGTYDVVVRDVAGNQIKNQVVINKIGNEGAPTVAAVVTNGTFENGGYTITEKTAKIQLTSSTATSLHIDTTSTPPNSWLTFSENVERYFEKAGEYTLYIWVKDASGQTNGSAYPLKIKVVLPTTVPTFSE